MTASVSALTRMSTLRRWVGSPLKLVHTSEEPNARSIVDSLADGEIIESKQIENAIDAVRDLLIRDALFAKARRKIQSGQGPSSGLEQEAKEAADRLRKNLREVLLLNKAFQTIVPMLFSTTDTMLQAAKRLRKCRAAQRKASLKSRQT